MTIHIGAQPGDIAQTVLLPGDPYRAKWAATTFLDDARLVNDHHTGKRHGHALPVNLRK